MPNILEDVIIEILSWLPVKSLLRIRCVSKSWLSLISSPNFIKLHVTKSFNNHEYTRHRLVFRSLEVADNYYKFRFKQGFFHPTFYDAQTTEPIDMDDSIGCNEDVFVGPSPRMVYFPIVNIVGSYNGLICVTSYGDIFLWNPSIRKSRKLPNFPPRLNSNNVYEFYAYGYDESNDDYKVFRILCGSEYYGTKGCLDLYSRNTNSWRRIEDLKLILLEGFIIQKGSYIGSRIKEKKWVLLT
ncbi:hypothetical protein ACH5RR_031950 [Cinchona calisaya]|uniref:F-box domain-containing protein n=1 Tax=Cinchona calisaya TaxID=153742 RepID=A0ABD2YM01_9GENT